MVVHTNTNWIDFLSLISSSSFDFHNTWAKNRASSLYHLVLVELLGFMNGRTSNEHIP
jgi:hypothetical protein